MAFEILATEHEQVQFNSNTHHSYSHVIQALAICINWSTWLTMGSHTVHTRSGLSGCMYASACACAFSRLLAGANFHCEPMRTLWCIPAPIAARRKSKGKSKTNISLWCSRVGFYCSCICVPHIQTPSSQTNKWLYCVVYTKHQQHLKWQTTSVWVCAQRHRSEHIRLASFESYRRSKAEGVKTHLLHRLNSDFHADSECVNEIKRGAQRAAFVFILEFIKFKY